MAGATFLSATLVVAFSPAPAQAYVAGYNDCNDRTLHWSFTSNSLWTTDKQSWVRAAINSLDDELSYDGTRLIEVTEDGGVDVDIQNHNLNDLYGHSQCFLGEYFQSIWVNSNGSGSKFFWQVGRHEMFHLGGAEHAGWQDSLNGDNPPTMATCIDQSQFRTSNFLAQDDAAYMNFLHNSLQYEQLHANIGFERGLTYWGWSNGSTSYFTSGGATGPGFARFVANGDYTNSYVYQTVRLWYGTQPRNFRAKINAKSAVSGATTNVRAALYTKYLQYSGTSGCEYGPMGNANLNNASVTSTYVYMTQSIGTTVGTGWTAVTSTSVDGSQSNYAGRQVQVRAYGSSAIGSTHYGVDFDNVRGELT